MAGYAMYAVCVTNLGYNHMFTVYAMYDDELK